MEPPLIALLGRQEKPTDGVEDYCHFLADALARRDVRMEVTRMDWAGVGWIPALRNLSKRSGNWRGTWVILHYTAMAWSRRGFPLGAVIVLSILRRRGARCAVLFHEATRQLGQSRLKDRFRGQFQDWVIRRCFQMADKAIFTIPLETVGWLPRDRSKAVYIPIGANIPERVSPHAANGRNSAVPKTVAVFCMSAGENRLAEIADLARAAERARQAIGAVRFVILGKGSAEAREELERALGAKCAEVCVLGRLSADAVADTLAAADVQLYLGAYVTQTRGSALAGVACGLPIVGYAGAIREPICEAGVALVASRDGEALADALVRVLQDDAFRLELRRRSVEAQRRHFSWDAIAASFAQALAPLQAGR